MSERRALLLIAVLFVWTRAGAEEPRVQDPTRPYDAVVATGRAAASKGFELTAVLVSPSRRIAVIGGRICHEGDRVNGDLIVRIEPGAVRIRRDGKELLMRLRDKGVQDL